MPSRVRSVRSPLAAEVKFLALTEDNLVSRVVHEGLREDKPAWEVRGEIPHPKQGADETGAPERRPRTR